MPKGPQGQKRPADVIGNAVHVMRIATGEIEEQEESARARAGRLGGKKGGSTRAKKLNADQRSNAATLAAKARWRRD
ncbi:MAG: RNA-binding protein [Alphaproteobacteria bacterium]|nr:RNA-binding protein [Alphaproteobacteria bacterium]MBV9692854.1 RNA-binding protein [Alphaproteobacteria bacterium]